MTVGGVSMQWRERIIISRNDMVGGKVSGADCTGPSAGEERPPHDDKRDGDYFFPRRRILEVKARPC